MSEAAGSNAPPLRHARGRSGRIDAEIERIAQMGSWERDIPSDSIAGSTFVARTPRAS